MTPISIILSVDSCEAGEERETLARLRREAVREIAEEAGRKAKLEALVLWTEKAWA